jgi:hypothetical protein
MGDLARLPRPDEAGDSYDVPMGSLLAPPRNPAMPPQSVVDLFTPNLSRPETYAPRSADLVPNAAGKVPTSDPLSTGAAADLANMAGYAIPFGGPTAAATKLALPLLAVGRRLVPAAEEAANAARIATGIRAYHSSPHDFEKFDFSPARARSGEGAQVYGEGGYFAENPAVSGQGGQYWQQFAPRFQGPEGYAANVLQSAKFDRGRAMSDLDRLLATYGSPPPVLQEARNLLESGKPVGPRTYEVNIKAHPDEMLNYDVPLLNQEPQVKAKLQDLMGRWWDQSKYADPRTAINKGLIDFDPRSASLRLQEAGIPGIRYLDQGSRALPPQYDLSNPGQLAAYAHKLSPHNPLGAIDIVEGPVGEAARELIRSKAKLPALADTAQRSSNYVMFPGSEHLVDIMKKYGMAGAVPAMGSLAQTGFNDREQ